MLKMNVAKFGGTSLKDSESIEQVGRIIADEPERRVIVVSAPGKISNEEKVTDMLIKLYDTQDLSLIKKILDRYKQAYPQGEVDFIQRDLEERLDDKDALEAYGEIAQAKLFAKRFKFIYVDPSEYLLLDNNGKILPESGDLIRQVFGDGKYITAGFSGVTREGKVKTLGRGGSDTTGAVISAELKAAIYENFSDRTGVFAADPCIIENPLKIKIMTFKEKRDLSYSGFKIFQSAAVIPVEKAGIHVHIRSTFEYPEEGTYLVSERISDKPIVGVAYREPFCSFDIHRPGLNEEVGILYKLLGIFNERRLSVEFPPGGVDDTSIILHQDQFTDGVVGRVISELKEVSKGNVKFQENMGAVVIAGKGLKSNGYILGEVATLLSDNGIDLRFLQQGPTRSCVIYGINMRDKQKAVQLIYDNYLAENK